MPTEQSRRFSVAGFILDSVDQVTIEKLVFGGQGLGRVGNKIVFVWGALPGETVAFRETKKKKNFVQGVVTKILSPAPERIAAREDHYLSCSPWATMTPEAEAKWKCEMAKETYERVGKLSPPVDLSIIGDENSYHYRNKIEYSFTTNAAGEICFAFHERGQYWQANPLMSCLLASEAIDTTAQELLQWIRRSGFSINQLKNLLVRSNLAGETIAALFITDFEWSNDLSPLPPKYAGFQVWYSDPRSPSAVSTGLLKSAGESRLVERVRGVDLAYGPQSFFQVNVPMFEKALAAISTYVLDNGPVIDYYAGVGSIGLSTTDREQPLTIVENNPEAIAFAKENVVRNGRATNVECFSASSEQMTGVITTSATIIVDPPRAGLDKHFVAFLKEKRPKRIIYLSCDLATQARDLADLSNVYKPVFWQLYNFFPRTPHIEGLVILDIQ